MDPDVDWYCEYPLETIVFVGGKEEKNIHKGKFLIRNISVLASRARRFSISSTNGDQMLIGFLSEIIENPF